ncbi:MAG: hypothetical protein WA981_12900 [Glaciecola sp.]
MPLYATQFDAAAKLESIVKRFETMSIERERTINLHSNESFADFWFDEDHAQSYALFLSIMPCSGIVNLAT